MKEVTKWDGRPRMMWVWDNNENGKKKRLVVHYLTNAEAGYNFLAENEDGRTVSNWKHCAEIEEPKRKTNYELAKWLVEGASCGEFREWRYRDATMVFHDYSYAFEEENEPCGDIEIRSNGGEWHEPLVEVEE